MGVPGRLCGPDGDFVGVLGWLCGSDGGTDLVRSGEGLRSSGVPEPGPGLPWLSCFCCATLLYAASDSLLVNTAMSTCESMSCRRQMFIHSLYHCSWAESPGTNSSAADLITMGTHSSLRVRFHHPLWSFARSASPIGSSRRFINAPSSLLLPFNLYRWYSCPIL